MRINLFTMLTLALLLSACGSDISSTDQVIVGGACEAVSDCPCPDDYEATCDDNQCLCFKIETTEPVEVDCHTEGCECAWGVCLDSGVCECSPPVPEGVQKAYFSSTTDSIGDLKTGPGAQDVITLQFQMWTIDLVQLYGLKVNLYLVGYNDMNPPLIEITQLISSATLEIDGKPVDMNSVIQDVEGLYNDQGNIAFGFESHWAPAYTLTQFTVKLSLRKDVPPGTGFITALVPCNFHMQEPNVYVADENGMLLGGHSSNAGCYLIQDTIVTVE